MQKQIDDIKTGNKKAYIEGCIQKEITKTFRKTDNMGYLIDNRNLQEIFTSILTTELIVNSKTDKKVKKELIRNHTDKIGLFDHLWQLYQENSLFFLDIHTGRSNHTGKSVHESRKESIDGLISIAKKILDKTRDISYFWIVHASQEEMQQQNNIGYKKRKHIIIDDLISHLEKTLQEPEKNGQWRGTPDSKFKKLFDHIYDITESHEFEDLCKKLRYIDEGKYRDMLGAEGKAIMKQTYSYMDQDERKIIKEEYGENTLFKQIRQEICEQEGNEQQKQSSLFDLPSIYHTTGYVENIITNITSLIGMLSYKQKRLLESVIYTMFKIQGIENHIDTSKDISPLSDEEFLEILKNSKNGKAISSRIKKTNKKILPDINDRIKNLEEKNPYENDI